MWYILTMHYVYILQCADGTLYTGYTTDITRRVGEHNAGKTGRGARYTAGRLPVTLRYSQGFTTRSEAQRRESQIKQLPRNAKLKLL